MNQNSKKLTIIGGGNLGSAIAKGIIASNLMPASAITVTRRRVNMLKELQQQGIAVTANNPEAVSAADIVILAIKPYQIDHICQEIAPALKPGCIIVSVATGIELAKLQQHFQSGRPIFRAMPNTAIEIGESITCLSAINSTPEQDEMIVNIFNKVGIAVIIPEELMGAATALGACGIAFALRFIRAATQAGIEIGFGSKLASQIVSQTVKGAAELIIRNESHPEEEIDKVTTPRGVTISGLNEMEHHGFSSSLIKGVITSYKKIEGIN